MKTPFRPAKPSAKGQTKPPGAKPVARITVYAVPKKKGAGRKR